MKPTQEQLSAMKLASQIIAECRPSQIVADSKYLTSTSLAELLSSIAANSAMIVDQAEPQQKAASLSGEDEDALVFYLELIIGITLENKDRLPLVWPHVRRHLEWLLSARFGRCPVLEQDEHRIALESARRLKMSSTKQPATKQKRQANMIWRRRTRSRSR